MACFNPLDAYKGPGGVVFKSSEAYVDEKGCPMFPMRLPCGNCIGCRMDRARNWAVRCMHEASLYDQNCVLTLTYDDDHLPDDSSLVKADFQNFMKRLRRVYHGHRIRYFHCGEYGERLSRPHYHAILFNFDFPDKKVWKESGSTRLYQSDSLEKIWGLGLCSIGDVSYEAVAYVARYVIKKVNGKESDEHYVNKKTGVLRTPEYITMSRRPGIASDWFEKYSSDVYPSDTVIVNEREVRPPRYYEKEFVKLNPLGLVDIKIKREKNMKKFDKDYSRDRLAVRERVAEKNLKLFKPRRFENG